MSRSESGEGRTAFDRADWAGAYSHFQALDAESRLNPEDLERWATSAYLLGEDDTCVEPMARAHQDLVRSEDPASAARCAFWIAFNLLNRGEMSQANGWLGRAQRLLEDTQQPDCSVHGYLLLPAALQSLYAGDVPAAHRTFIEIAEMGERFKERDLHAFGLLGQGQALIAMGELTRGVAFLDEVMVAVTRSELSAVVTGLVYCAVIDACQDIYDVRGPGNGPLP